MEPRGLYNLREDIGEQNNLVEQYPDLADELEQKLIEFDKELKATSRPYKQYE